MKRGRISFGKHAYLQLSELGSKFSMSFTSQEVLGNKIMGLDGIQKKLLVLEQTNDESHSYIIDLDDVKAISVKKSYCEIKAGDLKNRKVEDFLKTIHLQFIFGDKLEDIVLPFYDSKTDKFYDLMRLERKVMNWQTILSKIAGINYKNAIIEKSELQKAD